MDIRVCKGNKPKEPGWYLIKYNPGPRSPFCIEALYTQEGKWYTVNGSKAYPFNLPEKIIGFIPWGDLRNLFGGKNG